MCGIWASLGLRAPRSTIDVVAHRGPDGEGWREFESPMGPVQLGHRRLAIIDRSDAGLQPMSYADGRFWLTYNGEIYNYIELRRELEGLGDRFSTATDSEVLLAAYARWGEAALPRLNGMFAFVVWDDRDKVLFAARDRFGIKPLYLLASSDGLCIASEIKQIARTPGFSARLNGARAVDFVSQAFTDHTAETLFRGVTQLRGGESMRLDSRWRVGRSLPVRRWYALPNPGRPRSGNSETAEELRDLLTDSIRIRLRSDVPVGSCLSGGLDSSSIVCLARNLLGENHSTAVQGAISACHTEPEADERRFVRAVVEATGVRNFQVYPRAEDAAAQLERIVYMQDEPFPSAKLFSQWEVFRVAAENGFTVMLDGQGADEQLGGYHTMYAPYHFSLLGGLRMRRLLRELSGQRRRHGTTLRQQLIGMLESGVPGPVAWLQRARGRPGLHDWLSEDAMRAARSGGLDYAAGGPGGGRAVRSLEQKGRIDFLETSVPRLLRYEDRNSMAHSVEARLPFLDYRLVEFLCGLDAGQKIGDGETKRVLRRAMHGVIPPVIAQRNDKMGFSTPEERWIRGPLRDFVVEATRDCMDRFGGLFRETALRDRIDAMIEGRRPVEGLVWRLVSLGAWGRVFSVDQ